MVPWSSIAECRVNWIHKTDPIQPTNGRFVCNRFLKNCDFVIVFIAHSYMKLVNIYLFHCMYQLLHMPFLTLWGYLSVEWLYSRFSIDNVSDSRHCLTEKLRINLVEGTNLERH